MRAPRRRAAIGLLALIVVAVLGVSGFSMAAFSASMETLDDEVNLAESEAAAEVERVEAQTAPIGDASGEVDAYLRVSGWEGFSATAIKDQEIVVQGIDGIPDDVLRKATELAGGFPLVIEKVSFTQEEYLKATDALVERLGDDRTQLKYVSMPENKKIRIEILAGDRTAEIERITREVLNGFPLEIVFASPDDPGPQPLAGR